jgi:hypothetical protein
VGYLLATSLSAWERQGFVRSEVDSNGIVSILRLGLSDELDRLIGDLTSLARPLDAAQSKAQKADASFEEIRTKLNGAARRIADIKARYSNTPADEEMLRRLLLERYARLSQSQEPPAQPKKGQADAAVPPASGGK